MPAINARPTQTVEAIHSTDHDFREVVEQWLPNDTTAEEVDGFFAVVAEKPHCWVVRTSDGNNIGIVTAAGFAADWEDVAATDTLDEIWTERQRHASLGYDNQHDDNEGINHLANEAVRQIVKSVVTMTYHPTDADRRQRLIKAGSLILAAIDKIDRAQNVRTFGVD